MCHCGTGFSGETCGIEIRPSGTYDFFFHLTENFSHSICQTNIKLHSKHVKITLECHIFDRHFSPL